MDFLSALFILLYVVTASPLVRAESDTLRLVHIVILDSIVAFISISFFSIHLIIINSSTDMVTGHRYVVTPKILTKMLKNTGQLVLVSSLT